MYEESNCTIILGLSDFESQFLTLNPFKDNLNPCNSEGSRAGVILLLKVFWGESSCTGRLYIG